MSWRPERITVFTYPVVAARADTQAVTIDNRSAADLYERLTRPAGHDLASGSGEAGRCVTVVFGDPALADETHLVGAPLVRALRVRAGAAGWHVFTLAPTGAPVDEQLSQMFLGRSADVAIVLGGHSEPGAIEGRVPTVYVECEGAIDAMPQVFVGDEPAFADVVRHLIDADR